MDKNSFDVTILGSATGCEWRIENKRQRWHTLNAGVRHGCIVGSVV